MRPEEIVPSDPEIMSGALVFVGTRVPVYNLFDYLEAGDSLDRFLESFPGFPGTSRCRRGTREGGGLATVNRNDARKCQS